MLGYLSVTDPTQRPQQIGRHDQRTALAEWLDMVGGEWVAWVAVSLAADLAVRHLLALLCREPPPVCRPVRRWSAILRPLGRFAWTTDIAAVAVGREYAAGQARSLRPHALGKFGTLR